MAKPTYWIEVFKRAYKMGARPLRLDSSFGFLTLIIIAVVTAFGLGIFTHGAGIPTRIASVAVPLVLLPFYVAVCVPFAIDQMNAERLAEIDALKARVVELEAEGQSDIIIRFELNYVVHTHVDWPNVVNEYRVVIENVGPNHLINCVLRIGTVNQFNHVLHDRTWLHDASGPFELRRGDIKALTVLWTDGYNAQLPAHVHYHDPEQEHVYPMNRPGEIVPSDQVYYLFAEVLSANTVPAKLTVRIVNDRAEWHFEALMPGEKLTFD